MEETYPGAAGAVPAATAGTDPLEPVRAALGRQDWQAAHDLAASATVPLDAPEVEAQRCDLLAEALWWLGRMEDCIAARERAFRLFEDAGDRRSAGRCAVWLYEHHAVCLRPAIGSAWLRRARRSLDGDRTCHAYGILLLREAETAHGAGDLDRALSLTAEVIEIGRSLRSTDLEAEALQAAGRILIDRGQVADGMGHLDEAMLFAIEGRLGPYSTGKVYCSLISACEEVGDLDRAAEWTDATLRWAERHPFAIFPGICRVHRAIVLKRRGALAEAEREAARACEELTGRHAVNAAAAFAEVGDIRRRLGDLDRAEEAFATAQQLSGRPCGGLALLRLAQGRTDAAAAIVTGCLRETANRLARASLLPLAIHVAIAAGDLDGAETALAELEGIAATFGTPVLQASVLAARGRIELTRRDPAAVATLQQAVERWRDLGIPYEVATAQTLLGQALRDRGDDAGAAACFSAAAERFDQIGARLDAAQLSVRPRSRPTFPAGLTEREVEVLRLIAAGMTNNDIAAALFLSSKTVSRHLSNIFTKIGVSSRAAATAFAFAHDLVDARS